MARTRDPFQPLHPVFLRPRPGLGWALAVISALLLGWLAWGSMAHPQVQPELIQQGRILYQSETFTAAQDTWQKAATTYQTQGDPLNQALALSLAALAAQQLGKDSEAAALLEKSQTLIQPLGDSQARRQVEAQIWSVWGQQLQQQREHQTALQAWQRASELYRGLGDKGGESRSFLNLAQGYAGQGLFRRARQQLQEAEARLESLPEDQEKAELLHQLGQAYLRLGQVAEAHRILKQSQSLAKQTNPGGLDPIRLSLAHTLRAAGKMEAARSLLQTVVNQTEDARIHLQAQLHLARLSLSLPEIPSLNQLQQLQQDVDALPLDRVGLWARLHWSHTLLQGMEQSWPVSATQQEALAASLALVVQQARHIGDVQLQSLALGELGSLYEHTQQWEAARQLTEEALLQVETLISGARLQVRWQWQLGRIYRVQGDRERAIQAYAGAVTILYESRDGLQAVIAEGSISYADEIEPIYRQLVDLLLTEDSTPEQIGQARSVMELLQLAELDQFFRDACLDLQPLPRVQLEDLDASAAVVYPVMLPNRLELIVSLPHRDLIHYTIPVPQPEVETTLSQFRQLLETRTHRRFFPLAQQVYDWLIRPALADLQASDIQTLVFVLDGALGSIPMAALHDGEHYLMETYALALAPGLQLFDPLPRPRQQWQTLAAGLTAPRQGFPALTYVQQEVELVNHVFSGEKLLDQNFTKVQLRSALEKVPFPVVHIASHAQFSSQPEDTFILTWDDRLTMFQLDGLLRLTQPQEATQLLPIELLTLSACQTASGDLQAALGLAGVAVRAGARSTLATLWYLNDEASVQILNQFYQELLDSQISKAVALQRAQQFMLNQPRFQHPIYWALFVLIGNWL
ncbi:MAG: CHAT domain-containing protein [Synechococcaceae cyanobacterium SM2_3_1]|nr:CHAT domain-containing protein [Synechococcaceae cyanobacterium SM2_3_1]